jgi:TIR domain
MPEPAEAVEISKSKEAPLVFISHDSRDAELAEAFSKLLKSVSAGMLKPFRSSDKRGNEGIEFGDEWYKTLMSKLEKASDVVCLLTEQSLDRPWILYEAGVAKGKLGTPVHGVALGVPLSRASVGPFYQFQNSDDSEDSLSKLVLQICRRIPGLEPDEEVVATQVRAFKENVEKARRVVGSEAERGKPEAKNESAVNGAAVAKVLEEMKLVVREASVRSEEMMSKQMMIEREERVRSRRSLLRRLHPGIIEDMSHMISRRRDDPIGILILASLVREDFPWIYELGLEAYRVAKRGNPESTRLALEVFRDSADFTIRGPIAEQMGLGGREIEAIRELPAAIHEYVRMAGETPERKRTLTARVKEGRAISGG